MNVQDITGRYHCEPGFIAGIKSKVITDGRAPWAQGGHFDAEGHDPREKHPVGAVRRGVDPTRMIPAGGKIVSVLKGNQSSAMGNILGTESSQQNENQYEQEQSYRSPPSYMQPPITAKVATPVVPTRQYVP